MNIVCWFIVFMVAAPVIGLFLWDWFTVVRLRYLATRLTEHINEIGKYVGADGGFSKEDYTKLLDVHHKLLKALAGELEEDDQ